MDKQELINQIKNYKTSNRPEDYELLYSALEFENPFVVSFLDKSDGGLLELYFELIEEYTKQKKENMKYELEPTQLNVVVEKKEEKQEGIILPEKKSGLVEGTIFKKGGLVPNSIREQDECYFRIEQAVEFDGRYIINCKMIILK